MANPTIEKIERLSTRKDDGDRTLRYFIRPGSRSRPYHWFDPEQVPPFDGDVAWFEMERIKGGWRFLRQVPRPSWDR